MGLTIKSNVFITKTKKSNISKIDFALCDQPKDTLDNYYAKQIVKPEILINGGFFALSTGETVFDYIDEGKIISVNSKLEDGFGIDSAGELSFGKDYSKTWTDFVSAYPALVVNGKIQPTNIDSSITGTARRTILGYDDTYIYTISVDSPGITLEDTAKLAQQTGCKYAINLDGGGSTRLLYQGKPYAKAEWNRPVDNVVAIYTKTQSNSTTIINEEEIYRVQVGAFSVKQNAEAYCKKIQALGDIYKNAYVKFVSPYYKVQVGAFTIKQNASNMLADLKSKGIGAFIVNEKVVTDIHTEPIYSNSKLAVYTLLSPNNSGQRTHEIDRISPHCLVNQATAEGLGEWIHEKSTKASCNYGIDKDGRIGLYVDEANRSWCTSSKENDQRAVTIECASDKTDPYRMNDCVYASLINLCADICRRNGKNKLIWIPNKDQALSYVPKEGEMLITVHRWFANKTCPGDWLYSRLGDLANKVTAQLQ